MNRRYNNIRRQMQRQLDAQKKAVTLWRQQDPQAREHTIPQHLELTEFLVSRLNKTQVALKVAVKTLDGVLLGTDLDAAARTTRRLERIL